MAHLRNGDTYTRLAAGFAIGTSTAWRYVREGVDLLAAHADDVTATARRAARLAYAILDGTLIPIDRVANQKPYTPVSASATASTCRSSPIRQAGSSGPHPRCPVGSTT